MAQVDPLTASIFVGRYQGTLEIPKGDTRFAANRYPHKKCKSYG